MLILCGELNLGRLVVVAEDEAAPVAGVGMVSGLLLVAPPIEASLYEVKLTGLLVVPRAWRALPWFCTKSEAFCSLRVEPAAKTRVVLNGTDALPLVTPLLLPAGACSTKAACVMSPVIGLRWGVPGKATTMTGPPAENAEA